MSRPTILEMSATLLRSTSVDRWRSLDDASVVALLVEAGTAEYFAEHLVLLRDHPPVATEITRRLAAP